MDSPDEVRPKMKRKTLMNATATRTSGLGIPVLTFVAFLGFIAWMLAR